MSEQTPDNPNPGPGDRPDDLPTERQPEAAQRSEHGPKRLFRSRRDRVWTGVAGGLGEYFRIDPVIIRIAFAASVFIGGLGAFAYIAMALFVPAEPGVPGEKPSAAADNPRWLAWVVGAVAIAFALSWGFWDHRPFHGPFFIGPPLVILALVAGAIWIARGSGTPRISGPGGVLLRLTIATAVFIALAVCAVISAWAGATGHGVVVAVAVVVIGLGLLASAGRGNARWLIVPAVALAAPLGIVSAANIRFSDEIGDRSYTPNTFADIPADGYQFGVGRIAIDLRQADWMPGSVQRLNVDLGVGDVFVAVPHDVCVSSDLDADVGEVRVPGEDSNGVDAHYEANQSSKATPRLVLHGHVDLGDVRVVNDDDVSIRHRPDDQGSADDMRAACAAPGDTPVAGDGAGKPEAPAAPDTPQKPEHG
jgi:phage shock protein PspC (stress-responsive transcriptional regulator)/predicted membrane protein